MSGADFAARKYGAFIAAGDTKNNPKFGIVVTVAGKGAKNRILTRSNACPGDALVSIGWYGTMLAGLLAFKHGLALIKKQVFFFEKHLPIKILLMSYLCLLQRLVYVMHL